jgi:hypothetical protein
LFSAVVFGYRKNKKKRGVTAFLFNTFSRRNGILVFLSYKNEKERKKERKKRSDQRSSPIVGHVLARRSVYQNNVI